MAELTYTDDSEKVDRQQRPGILRFLLLLLLGAALLFGLWHFTSSNKKPPGKTKEREIPTVSVDRASEALVPIQIHSIGNVLPFSVVNVIPQVSGQLKTVYFKQGDFVKKGDLLFQIDPAPYEATLAQAQGNMEKDRAIVMQAEASLARDRAQVGQIQANMQKDVAQAEYASKQDARYKQLLNQGAVSHEQTDQMATNLAMSNATLEADRKQIENAKSVLDADQAAIKTAKGQLEADKAAVRTAQIQLDWTKIRSPLNGKTSSLNVYEGNVVTANGGQALVSIVQVKPIYVTFTVPEQHLDQVRKAMENNTLNIQAEIGGVKENAVKGDVSFLENTVNTATGTVNMRAVFDNSDQRLFPGQFVDVTLSIPAPGKSVVVPSTAIQTTQQGTAVFVLEADGKVSLHPVVLERSLGEVSALSKGIKAGDLVITDGQMQLTPGSKVKVSEGAKSGPGN